MSSNLVLVLLVIRICSIKTELINNFRPPATPLFLLNPTIQVWSKGDLLTDVPTTHWIETQNMSMIGLIRIDNSTEVLRFLGVTDEPIEAMQQFHRIVQPTQTRYIFRTEQIELNLTFLQPSFVDELEFSSLPIGYLKHSVRSLKPNEQHSIQIYLEFSPDFLVNSMTNDQVVWEETRTNEHRWHSFGHAPFQTHGDRIKPDWGYLYISSRSNFLRDSTQTNASLCRQAFLRNDQYLPQRDDSQGPRSVQNGYPVSAFVFNYAQLTDEVVSSSLVLFHDEQLSIDFFSNYLRPYWTRIFSTSQEVLDAAFQLVADIQQKADVYDQILIDRYSNSGGLSSKEYYSFSV